ncbi:MAG TPA: family 1 glycosylhydrolase [Polyangium sp.]|nr:family 1 glycosylhydrolase [Polyangium sp.]
MSFSRTIRTAFDALARDPHPAPCQISSEPNWTNLRSELPAGFLLGTATASHQIEGGLDNDWTDWERGFHADGTPHIKDRTVSGSACDSWNRFDEDLALMRHLGANAYRFSVEWSRLEPAEGQWNDEAAERYLSWARKLRDAGIEPLVTLHHFTLPRWVATQGGWMNDRTIDLLSAFTERVARKLGNAVDSWCTINEPNVLMTLSYLKGVFPPGLKDQRLCAQGLARLLRAHGRMAEIIREYDTVDADGDGFATRIGLAHHVRIFQPASRRPFDRIIAGFMDRFFNQAIIDAPVQGRITLSIPGAVDIDVEVPNLKGSMDWLGINYYGRDHVRSDFSDPSLSEQYVPAERPVSDLGWDIWPEGMYQVLKRYSALGLPIYVTENGIADHRGEKRPGFLRAHFDALVRAAREGVDVRGYFHWSLLDNFEWAEGHEPRFGLYRVAYDTAEKRREPTPAVEAFRQIARGLGLKPTDG